MSRSKVPNTFRLLRCTLKKNMTHWHNTCPSLRTSKKLSGSPDVFNGKPVTLLTHSKHSCASSSLYLLFIYTTKNKCFIKVFSTHWTWSTQHALNVLNCYDVIFLFFSHCSLTLRVHAVVIGPWVNLLFYCSRFVYNSHYIQSVPTHWNKNVSMN